MGKPAQESEFRQRQASIIDNIVNHPRSEAQLAEMRAKLESLPKAEDGSDPPFYNSAGVDSVDPKN